MIFKFFKRKKDELERLKKEILDFGFNKPQELITLIQPAVLLGELDITCPLGGSKLGGQPDLPAESEWPSYNDESMVFIGQINLSELANFNSGLELPKKGLLSFFIHFNKPENEFGAEYDFEPAKDHYKVLYFSNEEILTKKDFPETLYEDYQFPENCIGYSQDYQVPPTEESSYIINSDLDDHDKGLIFDFAHRYDDGFMDQIGGYPVPIQQGVDLDWAASTISNLEERYEKSLTLGKNYVNLFSFSLMYNFEKIGDSTCYFGITRENLKQLKFEETILILQDT